MKFLSTREAGFPGDSCPLPTYSSTCKRSPPLWWAHTEGCALTICVLKVCLLLTCAHHRWKQPVIRLHIEEWRRSSPGLSLGSLEHARPQHSRRFGALVTSRPSSYNNRRAGLWGHFHSSTLSSSAFQVSCSTGSKLQCTEQHSARG